MDAYAHDPAGGGEQTLALLDQVARERGACKLMLEVLQGNTSAIKLCERVGFAGYQLDPAMGPAQFFHHGWLDSPPVSRDCTRFFFGALLFGRGGGPQQHQRCKAQQAQRRGKP